MEVSVKVEIPEKASPYEIQNALLFKVYNEEWTKTIHRGEKEDTTDLEGKCGSCKHFRPIESMKGFSCYGKCTNGRAMGQRTKKACKGYEHD